MTEAELIAAMKATFGADQRRIDHALAVLGYARRIMQAVGGVDEQVVVAAALLHDIGIQQAERVHGSSAGNWQELEGPPIARSILARLGAPPEVTEHVCRIVANHHSARDIDTPEFRIIWDADWLVNLPEIYPGPDEAKLTAAISRIFRTQTGRELARQLYLQQRPQ